MKILAIEAANKTLAVALVDKGQVLGEKTILETLQHSVTLAPAVASVMDQAQLTYKDLDAIAVSNGPGSYTGLRIGVTLAKTLADTLQIPVIPVSSLKVLSQSTPQDQAYERVVAFFDARRDNVYAGYYDQKGNCLLPDAHVSLDQLMDNLAQLPDKQAPQAFVSPDMDRFQGRLLDRFPNAHCLKLYPSAPVLAQLAQGSDAVPTHLLTPYYLKRAEAEENWLAANHQLASNDLGQWVERTNVHD